MGIPLAASTRALHETEKLKMLNHDEDERPKSADLDERHREEKKSDGKDATPQLEPFTGYMLDYSSLGGSLS